VEELSKEEYNINSSGDSSDSNDNYNNDGDSTNQDSNKGL
jgi:hypothetical protein